MRKIYFLLPFLVIGLLAFSPAGTFDSTPGTLPFAQNWTNTGMITANDNWSGVPGIEGYLGQDITTSTGTDPQTLLGVSAVAGDLTVLANQSSTTISNGDVAEFDGIANPTIALQGSGTADAPYILIYLNTTNFTSVTVAYNLRDIDGTVDNAVQPVALQYRVGSSGNFTNVPAGFVADATTGPSLATLVTAVSAVLPAACDNQSLVQVRVITTNAAGNDEWVGVDDINISGTPTGGSLATLANLSPQPSGSILQGGTNVVLAGFSLTPSASVDFTSITVTSTGTATGTDVTNVRIFRDNDGNGAINGGDAAVGGASSQPYSASMVFSGITGQTGLTSQTNYLVVADVAGVGVSTPGNTTTVSSNTFTTTAASNSGSFTGNSRVIAAPPGTTTIAAGAGIEPASFSSLINTQGAAVLNFDFTIQDDGATPATDGAASQISQIILNAGTGNTVTNWNTAILGVELSDGTNSSTTATIGTSSITFTAIPTTAGTLGHIADDASKTYTLKIWLKTNLGAFRTTIDGQNFVFRIQTADVTVSGSQLATGQDVNSGSLNNVVDVTGTALAFVTQPVNTNVNQAMANVTVSVNDANGNRDLGSSTSINITSTGTLTGSPVTVAAASGLATFTGLTHTATGTGLTLNAERTGTLDWDVASNAFNILSAALAAWDFTGNNTANATVAATTFNSNLVSTSGANNITRGAGATASAATNSFRTQGFQNDGIATTNTDYFQVTLTAQSGFDLSLSSIDANVAGTATFANSPGVANQFAYSLDGTNFTLIGSAINIIGTPGTLPTIDLTGISALQNVSAGTTITIRYYASGQTSTGGWGFISSGAGVNGLAFGGTVTVNSSPNLVVSSGSLTFASQAAGTNSTSQFVNLSGVNLTGAPGFITVNAPSTDFQVSNDDASWGASTTIGYGTATLSNTPVYVRFTPQNAGPKSGNVTFSGGGDATPPTVAVSGTGTATYYSKAAGNLTDVTTWGINTDGTGANPTNFTTGGQIFTIKNRTAVTLDADWTVSGSGSKIVIGDGVSATDLTISPTLTITGLIDISALGELTLENSTIAHTYGTIATTSTIEFAQTGSYTIPNSITYGNLTLTGGTKTLSGNTTTVNGNIVYNGAVTLGAPGAAPFATIDLNGNYTINGTVVNPPDASSFTLIMNGGGTQTISGNSNLIRVFRLTAANNTNIVLTSSASSVMAGNASGGGVEIGAGSSITVNNNNISTFAAGGTRINGIGGNTGTFITSSTSTFTIQSTSASNSTLYFDATNNIFYSLSSAVSGGGLVIIGSNAEIVNSFVVSNGKLQIAEGATLRLQNATTLGGVYTNTNYIITSANVTTGAKGFLRVSNIPTGAFTFPVGTSTSYLPVSVDPANTSDFSVNTFTGITENGEPNGTAFTATQKADVVDAVWIVNRNGGSGDVTMTAAWPAALEGSDFSGFANSAIGIARHDGVSWGTIAGTGDNAANTATRTAISTFSPFAVGGSVGQILPVNFGNVKATQQSNNIKVEWNNLTELDVVNYSIERSADGRNFVSVGSVNARLNNGGKADYSFIDVNPFAGVNYYRIRSFETSGKNKYSIIVKVDIRGGVTQVVLYPNPVKDGQLTYQANNLLKGQYTIRIFNNIGQQVFSKTLNHPGGSVSESITLPALRSGVYSLQLGSDDNKFVKSFVVQ